MPNSPRASPTEQPAKRRYYPSLRAASASALSSTRETLPFKRTSLSLPPRDTIIALVHVVVGGDTRRRYHGSKIEIYSSQGGATRSNKRFHTSLS